MQTTMELTRELAGRSTVRLRRLLYGRLVSPRARYRHAVESLRLPPDARILSVGCGYMAPDMRNFNVRSSLRVGIDRVERFRRTADSAVQFSRADASALPFRDGAFHAVVCRSVIEHLEDPARTFAEIFRVLAPNGHFVFLTPNRYDYVSVVASLIPDRLHPRVVRLTTGRPEDETFPTHYRANSVGALKKLATSIGFEVNTVEPIREHPNYLQFHPAAYLVGAAYEQLVERHCKAVRPWLLGAFEKPGPSGRGSVAG